MVLSVGQEARCHAGVMDTSFPLHIKIDFRDAVPPSMSVKGIGVRVEGDRLAILQTFGPEGVGMTVALDDVATVTITRANA